MKIKKIVLCLLMFFSVFALVSCEQEANKESNWPVVEQNKYNLNLHINSQIIPLTFEKGTEIDLNKYCPDVEGYEFVGWFLDAGTVLPVPETTFKIEKDTTLYAKLKEINDGEENNPDNKEEIFVPEIYETQEEKDSLFRKVTGTPLEENVVYKSVSSENASFAYFKNDKVIVCSEGVYFASEIGPLATVLRYNYIEVLESSFELEPETNLDETVQPIKTRNITEIVNTSKNNYEITYTMTLTYDYPSETEKTQVELILYVDLENFKFTLSNVEDTYYYSIEKTTNMTVEDFQTLYETATKLETDENKPDDEPNNNEEVFVPEVYETQEEINAVFQRVTTTPLEENVIYKITTTNIPHFDTAYFLNGKIIAFDESTVFTVNGDFSSFQTSYFEFLETFCIVFRGDYLVSKIKEIKEAKNVAENEFQFIYTIEYMCGYGPQDNPTIDRKEYNFTLDFNLNDFVFALSESNYSCSLTLKKTNEITEEVFEMIYALGIEFDLETLS